jgi:3',5'-cyclic AMP phosphodiesterase CpdA
MSLNFRFAVISDLHIGLPSTIRDYPQRFHLVEVSIPALEVVLERLEQLDLDFLLLPGDLTQHGEPENHAWLVDRLTQLPYPVYVVPGNHDIPEQQKTAASIGVADFPVYYQKFGYDTPHQPYYSHKILPGVRLIGLNSNAYDPQGNQLGMGYLDSDQLVWLQEKLAESAGEVVLVMVHHNVLEHLPGQSQHLLGRRYMLENAAELLNLLRSTGVQLIFTGHLHVQDVAQQQGIYEITTGSLVSYPHPYRILQFRQDEQGNQQLQVESGRVNHVPDWEDLLHLSREWMGDRSFPFMVKLLTCPPLSLPLSEAEAIAPQLRHFWADISNGDAQFDFSHFPPSVRQHLEQFGAIDQQGNPALVDNFATLMLGSGKRDIAYICEAGGKGQ